MVELAPKAKQFLRAAFVAADVDRDELLSPAELDELFSTAPSKCAQLSTPSLRLIVVEVQIWATAPLCWHQCTSLTRMWYYPDLFQFSVCKTRPDAEFSTGFVRIPVLSVSRKQQYDAGQIALLH